MTLNLKPRIKCEHRGDLLHVRAHQTARGMYRINVFSCVQHGRCTERMEIKGTANCQSCPLYSPDPTAPPIVGSDLPGQELTKLNHLLGFSMKEGCACSSRSKQMDEWGCEGCRQHRDLIVVWLREAYQKTPKLKRAKAMALAVSTGLVCRLRPWRLFDSLVDEAIRLAESPATE